MRRRCPAAARCAANTSRPWRCDRDRWRPAWRRGAWLPARASRNGGSMRADCCPRSGSAGCSRTARSPCPPTRRSRRPSRPCRRTRRSCGRAAMRRVDGRSAGPSTRTAGGPSCRRSCTAGSLRGRPPTRRSRRSAARSPRSRRPRRCARTGPRPCARRAASDAARAGRNTYGRGSARLSCTARRWWPDGRAPRGSRSRGRSRPSSAARRCRGSRADRRHERCAVRQER